MDADPRVQPPLESGRAPVTLPPPLRALTAGASVVLLRPRRLRGTIAIVRRRLSAGWEVEIRSADGTPMHLTLPEHSLHLR